MKLSRLEDQKPFRNLCPVARPSSAQSKKNSNFLREEAKCTEINV